MCPGSAVVASERVRISHCGAFAHRRRRQISNLQQYLEKRALTRVVAGDPLRFFPLLYYSLLLLTLVVLDVAMLLPESNAVPCPNDRHRPNLARSPFSKLLLFLYIRLLRRLLLRL